MPTSSSLFVFWNALGVFMLSHSTCKFTRIIYSLHCILRIGAVHRYLIMNQVCALFGLEWSKSNHFSWKTLFLFGTIGNRKKQIIYSIDNIQIWHCKSTHLERVKRQQCRMKAMVPRCACILMKKERQQTNEI
jgi:hypothetical protein